MLVVKPSTMKASFLSVSYVLVTKWYSSPKCITGKMWSYRIYWWFISSSSQPWTPYGFFPVRRRREVAVVLPAPKIHLWLVPVERWPCGQLRKNLGVMIFRRLHMTMLRLLGFHLWVICTILQWSDELPYQERAPLWPPTNKGLTKGCSDQNSSHLSGEFSRSNGHRFSWPTHQTIPPDPWHSLLACSNCLSASNSVPSLFWAKSHSLEQYTPADWETQPCRLTLALTPGASSHSWYSLRRSWKSGDVVIVGSQSWVGKVHQKLWRSKPRHGPSRSTSSG